MLSVHFRRIALAQGLLADPSEKPQYSETARPASAAERTAESDPRNRPPSPRPDPRQAS